MVKHCPSRSALPVVLQSLLVLAGGGSLLLAPPAQGAMLLIAPGGDGVAPLNAAIAHGAVIIGRGPMRGSVIVRGDRDAMFRAVFGAGGMMIAARPEWCGEEALI